MPEMYAVRNSSKIPFFLLVPTLKIFKIKTFARFTLRLDENLLFRLRRGRRLLRRELLRRELLRRGLLRGRRLLDRVLFFLALRLVELSTSPRETLDLTRPMGPSPGRRRPGSLRSPLTTTIPTILPSFQTNLGEPGRRVKNVKKKKILLCFLGTFRED